VLHPWHKLTYFKATGWEDEWISAAENIVRAKFNRSYAHDGDEDADAASELKYGEEVTDGTKKVCSNFTYGCSKF
jgi:hypothetical protein